MIWDLCREYPGKIAVAIDVRPDHEIVTQGWNERSGRYLEEVLLEMSSAGVAAFLIAEAGRDPWRNRSTSTSTRKRWNWCPSR